LLFILYYDFKSQSGIIIEEEVFYYVLKLIR